MDKTGKDKPMNLLRVLFGHVRWIAGEHVAFWGSSIADLLALLIAKLCRLKPTYEPGSENCWFNTGGYRWGSRRALGVWSASGVSVVTVFCLVLYCPALSCLVLSCPVLSCLAVSCPVLICLALQRRTLCTFFSPERHLGLLLGLGQPTLGTCSCFSGVKIHSRAPHAQN